MNTLYRFVTVFFILPLLYACSGEQEQAIMESETTEPETASADLVLSNAYVYTVDAQRSVAQAVAVRDNEIVYVGDDAGVQDYTGPETVIRDLGGRMLMPGLHDMHIHAIGIAEPDMCDLNTEAMSLEQIVLFVKECIQRYQVPDGEWLPVLQWPFSYGNQPSERYPDLRTALDAVSDNHPIILWGDDAHHAAVNSVALGLAKDPDGNTVGMNRETIKTVFSDYKEMIAVDENGEPTGGINETARFLLRPDMDGDILGLNTDRETLMPQVAQKLAAAGVTTI